MSLHESLHEKISSFYDDELDTIDRDLVYDALKQDGEQKQIWGRYSIIGDAMRKNLPDNPDHNLLSRVQIALESEPSLLAPSPANADKALEMNQSDQVKVVELPKKSSNDHFFFKPFAGFAVAASVALASVLGFQMFSQPVDDFSPSLSQSQFVTAPPGTQELDLTPVTENVASFSSMDADEPVSEFDDAIYAQQSLMDDGQWTRITRIGNILLDNNILSHSPRGPESHVNVDLKTGIVPFARASNLDVVKPE
ncbi:MAG: sigma-E factor negative regulatory protein [Gammaproteobacteria bacterium]|nr:sigma-E factor negative regulatory protein [Gammaproteobacteria bacterium]